MVEAISVSRHLKLPQVWYLEYVRYVFSKNNLEVRVGVRQIRMRVCAQQRCHSIQTPEPSIQRLTLLFTTKIDQLYFWCYNIGSTPTYARRRTKPERSFSSGKRHREQTSLLGSNHCGKSKIKITTTFSSSYTIKTPTECPI